jgi:hypothetical protein
VSAAKKHIRWLQISCQPPVDFLELRVRSAYTIDAHHQAAGVGRGRGAGSADLPSGASGGGFPGCAVQAAAVRRPQHRLIQSIFPPAAVETVEGAGKGQGSRAGSRSKPGVAGVGGAPRGPSRATVRGRAPVAVSQKGLAAWRMPAGRRSPAPGGGGEPRRPSPSLHRCSRPRFTRRPRPDDRCLFHAPSASRTSGPTTSTT